MNYFKALRLQALKTVLDPDDEYRIRHIFRWYSQRFHTPLHEVYDLPQDDILEAFYESTYEEMNENERQSELQDLLMTEEEEKALQRSRDVERYEAYKFARFSAEDEKDRERRKKLAELQKDKKPAFAAQAPGKMAPATAMPSAPKPGDPVKFEPDVEVKFVSADTFEAELEGAGTFGMPGKPEGQS